MSSTRHSWPATDRLTYALFDPTTGHKHDGVGASGGPITGGVPINWRGSWSATTAYVANDGVSLQGSSYVATAPVTGTAPPAAPWQLVAQQGAQGATGPPGATGATGPAWTPTPITITGSRHQIRHLPYVLDQLLTALANQGLIIDNTTP